MIYENYVYKNKHSKISDVSRPTYTVNTRTQKIKYINYVINNVIEYS